jgi:YidC/Oxa1 family membrane protein insertase
MEEQNKNQNPVSSLIPILIIGVLTIILFQYLELSKPPSKISEANKTEELQNNPLSNQTAEKRNDFNFKNIDSNPKQIVIENEKNIFILNSLGGRIERIYLKGGENVKIPSSVIDQSKDEFEKKYQALEITRYKGMDFQPHLYKNQMVKPILNDALFQSEVKNINDNLTQVVFSKDIEFNDYKFTIYKIYRFLKKENFFHQITIIKNQTDKDFILNGDLFYKTFTALGPEPEDTENSRIMYTYGRFYNYDNSLQVLHGFEVSSGGFLGCGASPKGKYTIKTEKLDSLKYVGVNSRYFISYSEFLPSSNGLHFPDGIVLENRAPMDGSSSYTVVFWDLKLSKKESDELRTLLYLNSEATESTRGINGYLTEDKKRNDALIIDQIVYTGLRSDEEHKFFNKDIAKLEFGLDEPESSIRDVIYSSGFLALFSKLRDGIILMMKFINKYVNNYGVSIILIALFFKLITYPLNQVQAKTMKKIHQLKPELDRINEKYQDPTERQKKVMDLYKKHKINPAMGCLPILIQIPIFIALYSAFSDSIELWKSPFILWMKDLSQPDTIYVIKDLFVVKNLHINVLPLLMVGSQLLLQKMTTVPTDPQQKFLMYFMPIIMIFFFWSMPSGVTLYWTVQNIISVVWQLAVEKFSKEEKA